MLLSLSHDEREHGVLPLERGLYSGKVQRRSRWSLWSLDEFIIDPSVSVDRQLAVMAHTHCTVLEPGAETGTIENNGFLYMVLSLFSVYST